MNFQGLGTLKPGTGVGGFNVCVKSFIGKLSGSFCVSPKGKEVM